MKKQPPRSYHHGDLRRACVIEGTKILVGRGAEALTMRTVAEAAGVSPRAPYRHFADKESLLAAIAEEAFRKFGQSLGRALGAADRHPRRRLRALGGAYLDFAADNPELVQLMFGDPFPDRARRFPDLHRTALGTFAVLETEVGRLLPRASRRRRAMAATAAWAAIHGLSDLMRRAQLEHVLTTKADRRTLRDYVIDVLMRGIQSKSPAQHAPRC